VKIPNLTAYVKGEGIFECYHFGQRIRCVVPLAHNGSGVFGAKQLFLASMSCVKAFRCTLRAMSFQDLQWLQKLGSCKASFGAKVVLDWCIQNLTSTHMTLY